MSVIGLIIIALGIGFGFGRLAFGERIENLKSRIERRDERIAELERGQQFDAEKRIAELEARIADGSLARSIPEAKISALKTALAVEPGRINLIRDSGNPEAWRVYAQIRDAFFSAGWQVFEDYYLGPVPPSPSGLRLRRFPGFEDRLRPVDAALSAAGIPFEYVTMPNANPQGDYVAEILVSHLT